MLYDLAGNVTEFTCDSEGRCKTSSVTRTDEDGVKRKYTTLYSYDSAGNIISSTSPSGEVTVYEYDYRNNKTSETAPDGTKTIYTYDSLDNLIKAVYADGTSEEFTYDTNT